MTRGKNTSVTIQNYKVTLLLTNEKAKTTFTRQLIRPNHPVT